MIAVLRFLIERQMIKVRRERKAAMDDPWRIPKLINLARRIKRHNKQGADA